MPENAPQYLTLRHHRDFVGREKQPWTRRALILVVVAFLALGLANFFGQRAVETRVAAAKASLSVETPTRLRGGLYYQSQFHIVANEPIDEATLVLDADWVDGFTLNTLEPAPIGEASRDGDIVLELGHIPAGSEYVFFLEFQVNPTTVGRRAQRVTLADGDTPIATVDRTLMVFP